MQRLQKSLQYTTQLPGIRCVECVGVIWLHTNSTTAVGRIAQSVYRLVTGWTVRGSNPGGGEIFRTCPDRPWGSPSLLYNGYRVFPRGKELSGRDADLSPPSSAVGHERLELYLYSPYGPYGLYRASVFVQGWPLSFFFTMSLTDGQMDGRYLHRSNGILRITWWTWSEYHNMKYWFVSQCRSRYTFVLLVWRRTCLAVPLFAPTLFY